MEGYFEDVPFLVDLLLDAVQPIRRHVPDAKLSLEVVDDPEADNDRQLALAIVSPLLTEALMDRLRQLDDECG